MAEKAEVTNKCLILVYSTNFWQIIKNEESRERKTEGGRGRADEREKPTTVPSLTSLMPVAMPTIAREIGDGKRRVGEREERERMVEWRARERG